MAHIDNEFNERFSNQQLPNDNFDTEGLWDAISEDLGDKQGDTSDAMLGKNWMTKFILLSIIGGIMGLIYLKLDKSAIQENSTRATNNINNINQDNNKFTLTDSKDKKELNTQIANTEKIVSENNLRPRTDDFSRREVPNQLRAEVVSTNALPKKLKISSAPSDTKQILSENIDVIKNMPSTSAPSSTDDFSRRKIPSHLTAEVVSTDALPKKSKISPAPSDTEQILSENIDVAKSTSPKPNIQTPQTNISNEIYFENTLTDNCDILPTLPVEVKPNQPSMSALTISTNKNRSNKLPWIIDVVGGVNTVDFKFQSDENTDLADLKKNTEKADLGTSAGINIGLLLKNQWTLTSGIEYHQLRSKLDYEKVENIQIVKEDELLTVWIDATTGDTLSQRYGDTIINAVSTRTVLHHNSYQRFSIPVEFGVLKNTEKLIYGVKVGAIFNFTNAQSGRTIDKANQLVDFTNNDTTSPFKAFDIGLRVSPLIGYCLSEHWSINLQPQWTWYRNTFQDTDLKIGIHQFNMNLGLRYYIK